MKRDPKDPDDHGDKLFDQDDEFVPSDVPAEDWNDDGDEEEED